MRCRFAFSQTSDGRLLVTMEALWGLAPGLNGKFCVQVIDDENTFIQSVVLAELSHEDTIEIIGGILLALSERANAPRWTTLTLCEKQLAILGMGLPVAGIDKADHVESPGFQRYDLARAVMNSPSPVSMMSGPEHIITFINPAFLHMLGRPAENIKGRPVREALSDLKGQPFFALLDQVFTSGEPFIGHEMPAQVYDERLEGTRERFFDFVYEPVRDESNRVSGILCQATEVTERVLERHVRESREEQLYRQWAELDAIYRESPLGMCLIDAKSLRIMRLNKMKARLLGKEMEELVGRRIGDVSYTPHVEDEYRKVIASKKGASFEVEVPFGGNREDWRRFLWNVNPVFSPSGEVEAIASTVTDCTVWPCKLMRHQETAQEVA